MIRFIGTSVAVSLTFKQYSTIADLHTLQFIIAHAEDYQFPLVISWQRISTQKLALQIIMQSSCHFLFSHPGTSELN
jgi:hypothetical protein